MEAKSFLASNNIKYEDLNVAADKALRKEMIDKSGQMTVPVIDIDGELFIGFEQGKIKEKLGL